MNNDINEGNPSMTPLKKDKKCKTPLYRMSKTKQEKTENEKEAKNINSHKKRNSFIWSPTLCRRKTGNIKDISIILEPACKTKKSNRNSDVYARLHSKENISSIQKPNHQNNNKNKIFENNLSNLLKFTNNLYNNDEHLNKGIITKKIDMNNFPNTRKNSMILSSGKCNNIFHKKKLIISFGLNDPNKDKNNAYEKLFLRKVSNSSNKRNNCHKNSFSNYLTIKKKKSPSKERKMESNQTIHKINIYGNMVNATSNKNNNKKKIKLFNSIINNDGDKTSKSSKYNFSRAKTFKPKKIINEKILEESIPITKTKTKNYSKLNFHKSKIIETNKNDMLETKNTSPNNKNIKTKKNNFFCCLNCRTNDDSDIN